MEYFSDLPPVRVTFLLCEKFGMVSFRYTMQEVGVADAAATGYAKWYIARLRLLNRTLADGREFLCSNRLTVADICIVYALYIGTTLIEPKSQRYLSEFYKPMTKQWMNKMLQRNGWLKAIEMEKISLKKFQNSQAGKKTQGGGKLSGKL